MIVPVGVVTKNMSSIIKNVKITFCFRKTLDLIIGNYYNLKR